MYNWSDLQKKTLLCFKYIMTYKTK